MVWDKEVKYEEVDQLYILEKICLKFFFHKYKKIFTIMYGSLHLIPCLIQFYYIFFIFNTKQILQYNGLPGIYMVILVSIVFPYLFQSGIQKTIEGIKKYSISVECAEKTTQKKIMQTAKITSNLCIMLLVVVSLCGSYINTLRIPTEEEFYFAIDFVKWNFPEWFNTFYVIYYVSFVPIFFDIMESPILFTYVIIKGTFQVSILNDFIKNIDTNMEANMESTCDKNLQKQISDRLRFCFEQYTKLREICVMGGKIMFHATLAYSFAALMLGGTICIDLFFRNFEISYVREFTVIIAALSVLITAAEFGQKASDTSQDSYTLLCDLPWYNWNNSNKKTFLIGLQTSSDPISFTAFGGWEIARPFVLKILNPIYSLTSVAPNLVSYNST